MKKLMKQKKIKTLFVILAVGLLMAIAASLLTGIVKAPVITEHDFNFAVTYRLDGETKTLAGVYRCYFHGNGTGDEPQERYYGGEHLSNPSAEHPAEYTIAQKDDLELCIVTYFSDRCLMGEADGRTFSFEPYLAAFDRDRTEYTDEETLSRFDAEILDWVSPEPIANSFRFAGFSKLHDVSMLAMLAVGILTILACMIFIKREKNVLYNPLDKISIVLNLVICFAAIPIMTILIALMQIVVSSSDPIYQIALCVPAITAFTLAASVALRRIRYTKTGFFLQLIGPVLFVLTLILSE